MSAADKHRSSDFASAFTFPVCPECGNLCGKLARLCADCGAFLYEPNTGDRLVRFMLHGKPPSGEDTTPTKGTEA